MVTSVELLLDEGTNPDTEDNEGRPPLSYVAEYGGSDGVVQLLLDKTHSFDSKDRIGRTPLSYAAGHAGASIVNMLLERKVSIDSKGNNGRTPLFRALENPVCGGNFGPVEFALRSLLRNGASINIKDNYGLTPLIWACLCPDDCLEYGLLGVVQQLLNKGAEPEAKDNKGRTPYDHMSPNLRHLIFEDKRYRLSRYFPQLADHSPISAGTSEDEESKES